MVGKRWKGRKGVRVADVQDGRRVHRASAMFALGTIRRPRCGVAWRGTASHGMAWHGMACCN